MGACSDTAGSYAATGRGLLYAATGTYSVLYAFFRCYGILVGRKSHLYKRVEACGAFHAPLQTGRSLWCIRMHLYNFIRKVTLEYAESLNKWFLQHQREMPWRLTRDPYCIWVSEIMLQQTQVDTVIPYYERFIEQFPTLKTLAEASLEEVFFLWRGLGYYRRAENLHKGAKKIIEELNGSFPGTMEESLNIPGIGAYTAGAIMSIAFNLPVPAVDGNVMRILSRQFALDEDISKPKARNVFEKQVMSLMGGEPRIFNQAMMELGALICTPKSPKCDICPLIHLCKAYVQGNPEAYPVKSKKPKPLEETYVALILQKEGAYLLEKRPAEGLLANLWGFPLLEEKTFPKILEDLLKHWETGDIKTLEPVNHVFTHRKWCLKPVIIAYSSLADKGVEKYCQSGQYQFFIREAMSELPIATVFQKVIDQLG